jgi:hypothetical protein
MKWIACFGLLVASSVLGSGRSGGAPLPAAPNGPDLDGKTVKIVNKHSGKVVTVDPESNHYLIQSDYNESKTQQWLVVKDGDFLKLACRENDKVMDVMLDSKDPGGAIIQWDEKETKTANQRWRWEGDGRYRLLRSKWSDLVVEVAEGSKENGIKLIQAKPEEKRDCQYWEMVIIPIKP